LARRLALALEALHRRGVLHRDLKPHNVMLKPDGTPVLMDFGLARGFGVAAARLTRLTATGAVVGAPAYMPPEQADAGADDLGPAADVYGLGVILYELLTGRLPFEAATPGGLLRQVLFEPPRPPSALRPGVPASLDAVCLKAMAKSPADRYPDAAG